MAAIAGVALGALGGLLKLIRVADKIAAAVESHRDMIDKNARHLDSVMATLWPTIWRVSSIEDFLEAEQGYRPPKLFPSMPGAEDDRT